MKYYAATLLYFFISSNTSAQSKATIGMTISDVEKIYPGMKLASYENTTTLSVTINYFDKTYPYYN